MFQVFLFHHIYKTVFEKDQVRGTGHTTQGNTEQTSGISIGQSFKIPRGI